MVQAVATPVPDKYVPVYNVSLGFNYTMTAISCNLTNPPLVINVSIIPKMITDKKWYQSREGSKEESGVTTQINAPSPYAYLLITVYDKNSKEILLQDGYAKGYDTGTARQFKVLRAGLLWIEFKGNDLTAIVNMSVKEEGNINPVNQTQG
jgi:hypothetical protein